MKYIVGIPLSIGWFVRNFNVIFICLKCHGLRVTWWVSLVDRKRLTLPEHMTPPRIFAGSYCSMYGFLYSVFVDRCLFLLLLATVLSVFSIYGYWLPLWLLYCLPSSIYDYLLPLWLLYCLSSSIYGYWLPLWLLYCLSSSIYGYWLPLWLLYCLSSSIYGY
jgi:hypothetical protein